MSMALLDQIDEGSFGKIYLARKNGGIDDGKIYAIKSIKSDREMDYNEQHRCCCTELKVFKDVYLAPFLVQLKYSCKTLHTYHFVMDFIPGGNLFHFVQIRPLTLAEAAVCSAEIVLALAFLHERRIVYRDLKLENIMVDVDGHILLTDFGLARKVRNNVKLNDEAGTRAYFAPEMLIADRSHSYEVDWWAFGILIHELLVGHSPFLLSSDEAITDEAHCDRIIREQPNLRKFRSSPEFSLTLQNLIQKLLIKNPDHRLGNGQHGFEQVKLHEFFKPLNWIAVKLKKYSCIQGEIPVKKISLNFDTGITLPLNEPIEKARAEFYYVAPELRDDPVEQYVYGSTEDDIESMPERIPMPNPMPSIDILLKTGVFIRTTSVEEAAKTIKLLAVPRKTVRFSSREEVPRRAHKVDNRFVSAKEVSNRAKRVDDRFSPSKVMVRRSNRIAKRRSSAFS